MSHLCVKVAAVPEHFLYPEKKRHVYRRRKALVLDEVVDGRGLRITHNTLILCVDPRAEVRYTELLHRNTGIHYNEYSDRHIIRSYVQNIDTVLGYRVLGSRYVTWVLTGC